MAARTALPTVAAAPALRRIESDIPIQVDFANLSEVAAGNGAPPDPLTWAMATIPTLKVHFSI
jgi:hypothetical protein